MRRRSQRSLCRFGYLLGCLLPTMVVGGWSFYLQTPMHATQQHKHWESQLSQATGMLVTIASITTEEPGEIRFQGVKCADRETGQTVLTVRQIDAASKGDTVTILALQPLVHVGRFQQVWQLLEKQLSQLGESPARVILEAEDVTLMARKTERSQTLRGLHGLFECRDNVAQGSLDLKSPD